MHFSIFHLFVKVLIMILILSLVLLKFYNAHAEALLEPDAEGLESYTLTFGSPIYMCSDDVSQTFADTSQVEVYRHNESYSYMTGVFQLLKPIEDGTMLEIITEKEVLGSYEMMSTLESCDFCKELGDPESFYADYLEQIDFPNSCPIPAGTYHIKNLVADNKHYRINLLTEGRYLVNFNVKNNPTKDCLPETTFIACFKVEAIIEPQ